MERVMGREGAMPAFTSEAEERAYWEAQDSSDAVDWSRARRVRLANLKPSTVSISLQMPMGVQARFKMWLAGKVG